jgi:hypothetical protein
LIGASGEEFIESRTQSLAPNVFLISVNILLALPKKEGELKHI